MRTKSIIVCGFLAAIFALWTAACEMPDKPAKTTTIAVTGIAVNPPTLALNVGDRGNLSAAVQPDNATNKNVLWTSNDTSIAMVDSSGTVIALAAGMAVITATTEDGGKTAFCTVTVSLADPNAVAVTGVSVQPTLTLSAGDAGILSAAVQPDNATNKTVIWASSDTSVATVSQAGIVTALAEGTATITVTTVNGSKTASCEVTVNPADPNVVAVTGVSVEPTTLAMSVGESKTLTAAVQPDDATNKNVLWASSNSSVATVSQAGIVSALALGTATITATTVNGSKTASCEVTVSAADPNVVAVTGVSVQPTTLAMSVGESKTLTAAVQPDNATNKNVLWASSNSSVATVSQAGIVTALTLGTATIIVTNADGGKTASCAVTVSPADPNVVAVTGVSVQPTTLAMSVGESKTLTAAVQPDNATNKNVLWTSSNASVATVSQAGIVNAITLGTATITVTTADGGKTASCAVTVSEPINPPQVEKSIVFQDGFITNGTLYQDTNWGDDPAQALGQFAAFGAGTTVSSTGGAAGGSVIKMEVAKVTDFYVLGLKFDGFDLGTVPFNVLRLDAKTDYTGTGFTAQTPAFEQIIFGEDDGDWWEIKNAVHYMGETGPAYMRQSPLIITNEWKTFSVPIPVRRGKINLVQLFFTPKQIEGVTIYLDNIYFDKIGDDAVLKRVELPSGIPSYKNPMSGNIPYKNAAGQTLETDLAVLTMETNLTYLYDNEEYVFFGENPDINRTEFLNKFTEWYGVSNIQYTVTGNLGTVANGKLTPSGYERTGTLSVKYVNPLKWIESCQSEAGMELETLGQTTTFTSGMRIDGFDTIGSTTGNVDNWTLPFFHRGDAGDAQWYGGPMLFFIDDITKEGNFRPNGTLYDSWYQMGYLGLNHNLSEANEIVVNMQLRTGIVYLFTLVSGWSTVPETLRSSRAVITGTSDQAAFYVLRKSDFTPSTTAAGGVDWENITGYFFLTDKYLNTSAEAKASWSAASGSHHQLVSITAR